MKAMMAGALILFGAVTAQASIQITEWMYSGTGGEFMEFTNVGLTPVDMTGWSYDDDGAVPGKVDLSAFGIVAPGESVVITESAAVDFIAEWSLSGVKVIGDVSDNIGRADTINLFNASDLLADTLTYNDQAGQGPRTQNKSCNIPAADYGLTVASASWVLASVGDSFGSYASAGGDIGSPGAVPEPATLTLLLLGTLGLGMRRRS